MRDILLLSVFFIFLLAHNIVSAQERSNSADSLLILLEKNKGEKKVEILHQLVNELFYIDTRKALEFAEKALVLSDSIGNKKQKIIVNNDLGILYRELSEYEKARTHFHKVLQLATETNDSLMIARVYGNLGNTYINENELDKALSYFIKALKIFEKLKKSSGIAMCYAVLGNLNMTLLKYDKALEYYIQARDYFKKLNDEGNYALATMNIGVVYKSEKKYDKAISNLNEAIQIFKKNEYLVGEGQCYANLGNIYYLKGEFQRSYDILKKALELFRISDNKNEIVIALYDISVTQDTLKLYDEALGSLKEALAICTVIESSPGLFEMIYRMTSQIYAKKKDFQNAYNYLIKHLEMHDTVYNQQSAERIEKLNAEFESERQANKIKLLTKDIEKRREQQAKQRIIIYSCIVGLLMILIIVLILLNRYKMKKRANIELEMRNQAILMQKEEILTQKDEIVSQRDEIEAQRDKLGLQNEILSEQQKAITDSINYAKRIQTAMLPKDDFVNNILKEHFILYKPKDIVSGDFYWETQVNDWLVFTVADCTGHGVPGAFMSMLGVSFLNEIVRKKEITDAKEILNMLRESVIEALQQKGESDDQKDGMDIALCAINMKTNELQYSGANNPCWIVTSKQEAGCSQQPSVTQSGQPEPVEGSTDQLIELKPDKQPIGIHTNMQSFTNQTYLLKKGDLIYLMSDGYEDQFGGPNRKKFLAKNLKNLLLSNSKLSMAEQKEKLELSLDEWIGNEEQIDDITIFGVKI